MKKKPRGFYATCQCKIVVGAMDYEQTDRKEAGQLLGRWLHEGCVVTPFFAAEFSIDVGPCNCKTMQAMNASESHKKAVL
jgi:hypothetical protein